MQDIYQEFVAKAIARAQAAKVGDPLDEATALGPQVRRVDDWILRPSLLALCYSNV